MWDIANAGGHVIAMDITKEDQVKACVDQLIREQGHIDVLLNNAGFGMYGAMEDTAIDDARYQFEVNIFGLARLTQLVLPHMRKQQSGKIINISSMGGKMYTPLGSWYHATKHALEGWSDCLRVELKPFGIDVVIVEPGLIVTEFGDVLTEPMLKRSGTGPYAPMAQAVAKATRSSYQEGQGTSPELIAEVIRKAIKAEQPKIRYVAGKYAKPMIFIRKYFGDRLFDKLLGLQMKQMG